MGSVYRDYSESNRPPANPKATAKRKRKFGGWFRVDRAFTSYLKVLKPTEKDVVLLMLSHQALSKDNICFASMSTFAEMLGHKDVRQVQRGMEHLEKLGWVETLVEGHGHTPAVRRLTVPARDTVDSAVSEPQSDTTISAPKTPESGKQIRQLVQTDTVDSATLLRIENNAEKENNTSMHKRLRADARMLRSELERAGIKGNRLFRFPNAPKMTRLILRQAIAEAAHRGACENPGGMVGNIIEEFLQQPPPEPDIDMLIALQLVERKEGEVRFLPIPKTLWSGPKNAPSGGSARAPTKTPRGKFTPEEEAELDEFTRQLTAGPRSDDAAKQGQKQ